MPVIPLTDFDKKKKRGNCFNFLSVQRYRQTPTNQIIIDSPRLYGYIPSLEYNTKGVSVLLSIILDWL